MVVSSDSAPCAARNDRTALPVAKELNADRASRLDAPHRWKARVARRLVLADIVAFVFADVTSYVLREWLGAFGLLEPFKNELVTAIALVPGWVLAVYLAGGYRAEALSAGWEMFKRFYYGLGVAVFMLGFTSFLFNLQLSRVYVGSVAVLAFTLGTLGRMVVRYRIRSAHRQGKIVQMALLVGVSEDAKRIAREISRNPQAGFKVLGFLDDDLPKGTQVLDGIEVVGKTSDLPGAALELGVGVVIVSGPAIGPGSIEKLQERLEGTPIDLALSPSLFQIALKRVRIEPVGMTPIMHIEQIRLTGFQAFLKRTFDLLCALVLLVMAIPVIVVVGVVLLIFQGRPVIFSQTRVGKDGRQFKILKFRTMKLGAERHVKELAAFNETEGYFFKMRDDPRVTRVGKWLRRWSVDELPQLLNVLRGDMAMVGPRPPLPEEVAKYEPWHMRRLRVRPGLTGLWQVSGRSLIPFDEAVRLDLLYIQNWSIGTDLAILAKTVMAVVSRRGAY